MHVALLPDVAKGLSIYLQEEGVELGEVLKVTKNGKCQTSTAISRKISTVNSSLSLCFPGPSRVPRVSLSLIHTVHFTTVEYIHTHILQRALALYCCSLCHEKAHHDRHFSVAHLTLPTERALALT